MEQEPQTASDLLFDVLGTDYDPLIDLGNNEEDPDDDDSEGQLGPHVEYQAEQRLTKEPGTRSVPQRIEDLFSALGPRRRVLLGILEFLDEPRHADVLQQKVEELQKYDMSVFSGYNFSMLLHEAGAIQKVNEDGSAFDEEAEQQPDIVEIDGLKFFKPTNGKQVFWLITDEGRVYLEADDPFSRFTELITGEPHQYRGIYKSVLEFCGNEEGKSAQQLLELIDDDPIVQEPRRYSSYFVKKLEDCNALLWADAWRTTELGKKGLEILFYEKTEAELEEEIKQLTEGRNS